MNKEQLKSRTKQFAHRCVKLNRYLLFVSKNSKEKHEMINIQYTIYNIQS